MAVHTIYILAGPGVTPNFFGVTQLDGSAPTAANSSFGWTPGQTALTTPYYRGRHGSVGRGNVAQAASWNASTAGPTPGTGTTITTSGDSFIAGPFTGVFAATAWTFNFNLRAAAVGCVGHVNMRVWKSANADGSSATQLGANMAGATVTLSTSADTNSLITWSPGAITLANEYLFFQVEWQETTLGTAANSSVVFSLGTAAITTPDLGAAAPVTGTLAITQAAQTLTAAGGIGALYGKGLYGVNIYSRSPVLTGALAVTQANQTLAATGTVFSIVTGALSLFQANQALSAAGATIAGGALNLTQANQTLAAQGKVTVGATLGLTQANQTIAATGGPSLTGGLSALQAAQTLNATGSVLSGNVGSLNLVQANQTLSAAGNLTGLALAQADQTLVATGAIGVGASLAVTQADQTISAAGGLAYKSLYGMGTYGKGLYCKYSNTAVLILTQDPNTLIAGARATGLHITQQDQTLSATAVAYGLNIVQDDQVLVAHGIVKGWGPTPPPIGVWTPSSPCPPSMWTPIPPCVGVWTETELCDG